jgi:hypothetical protein
MNSFSKYDFRVKVVSLDIHLEPKGKFDLKIKAKKVTFFPC